jgi:PAS domain S-box-containing protein
LHVGNPLVWGHSVPVWWFPPLGISLALVAWLGRRAALLVFADVLLVALQAHLTGTPTIWGDGWQAVRGSLVEAGLLTAEVLAAWTLYHSLGGGSRSLGDPRSAMLFLMLVPGVAVGLTALLLAVAAWGLDPGPSSLLRWLCLYWLSHALGVLVLTPPLLATLTPWLVRNEFALSVGPAQAADAPETRPMDWGDLVMFGVIAMMMALLTLRQMVQSANPEKAYQQLWGLPMLVIVWASLRHGLRGGTVMAAIAVGAPLLLLLVSGGGRANPFDEFGQVRPFLLFLQANLLAECSTALLAAALANWMRLSDARRRRALEVVRTSEERYRELVEALPIMLVQFDTAGHTVYMNPKAQSATGYEIDELASVARWEAIAHADDVVRLREAFAGAIDGRTARLELRYRTKGGVEKVGYLLVEPRHQDGGTGGVTALVVDMTRERQLEAELQHAQRLELIGRLASGITHDFSNLLSVILMLADLVRNELPEDHPSRDDLRRIAYAGEQAANLCHQLLAFTRQRRPAPQRIDVNRVAGRTLELLTATLPRAIHIEPALAFGELPVQADEMQLQQVLMNLCLNARDAMPHGGRLSVRTEAHAGNGRGHGDWVRLSVQDNGEGIPQELQGRIFDAFFTTKERGTGLGLAMVRQIVESFGGHVEVSSRPGQGARFDVWLPREADDRPAQSPGNSDTGFRSGEVGSMPT